MIIGTAGHIDHGKSALVTALTGRAVDRLAEEKRRGITIELNFAPLEFPGLPPAGIVDVPGHEDFIRTMVAGASGVDLVLLVIDLAEGPRPQTFEHLAIIEQLRIPHGIPVFTKADLVDADWADLVIADLAPRLAQSPVAFGPPAVASAVSGAGIPELTERLRVFIAAAKERSTADGFRLPVDRAFSLAGVGTVVTGTTWSGTVAIGEEVVLLPLGVRGRVRSIEAYGASRPAATPATRTAIGLAGIDRVAVTRGEVLVGGQVPWRATTAFDAEISLVSSAPRPVTQRTRVRIHLGTAEVLARLHPRGDIRPGATGLARVVLERSMVARGQDRFVLRSYSPVSTIGGGWVIDPDPPARSTWPEGLTAPDPAHRLEALLARRPLGIRKADVSLFLGVPPREAESVAKRLSAVRGIGDHWVPTTTVRDLTERAIAKIGAHHRANPEDKGLSLETVRQSLRAPEWITTQVLGDLERAQKIRVQAGVAALPDFSQSFPGGSQALETVIDRIKSAGLEPPILDDLATELGLPNLAALVRHAAELGTLVAVERNRYFHREALDRFRAVVQELGQAGEISPAGLRERLGLTRKYLIPLLEWSDRAGLTRRTGDGRVLELPMD